MEGNLMDPSLYKAVIEGKVDVLMQYNNRLEVQVTPNNNTVLHVAAQFGQFLCVAEILSRCALLLRRKNIKGETPIHIAAREGYYDIVKAFIDHAKEVDRQGLESWGEAAAKEILIRAKNEDSDTALHMAVRNCHLEVVKLLTSEDPTEFQHAANKADETPLYLAAERRYDNVVSEILRICTAPAYGGPGGRTALHAVAISCSDSYSHNTGQIIIQLLLNWKRDLINKADEHGWTPLHYAARCGNVKLVRQMLKMDNSLAASLSADNDGKKTALHIATAIGDVKVMENLLLHCPYSWEIVNDKAQNILHIAVEMEEMNAIIFILGQSWSNHLVNQKDNRGNTPLHLLAASNYMVPDLKYHKRADGQAVNGDKLIPLEVEMSTKIPGDDVLSTDEIGSLTKKLEDILGRSWPVGGGRNIVSNDQKIFSKITKWKRACREYQKEAEAQEALEEKRKADDEVAQKLLQQRKQAEEEDDMWKREGDDMRKIGETLLIVATLIATVTFAAGFTLPGGYDGNKGPEQGMAILVRKAAFKVFFTINTIALICSTSSTFLYVTGSFYSYDKRKMRNRYAAAFNLILIAMVAMVVAFITSAFVVLAHSLGLAIATCVVGCLSFLIYLIELKNLGFFRNIWNLMRKCIPCYPDPADSKIPSISHV